MFEIKRGDLEPVSGWLEDVDGRPLPLAQATGLLFSMRPSGVATALVGLAVATITDASTAAAQYRWQAGQTDPVDQATTAVAFYEGEFKVLWKDGGTRRVPNRGFIPIALTPRVA
jgi:hypothetical protein